MCFFGTASGTMRDSDIAFDGIGTGGFEGSWFHSNDEPCAHATVRLAGWHSLERWNFTREQTHFVLFNLVTTVV